MKGSLAVKIIQKQIISFLMYVMKQITLEEKFNNNYCIPPNSF